jgi:hypothetical protein
LLRPRQQSRMGKKTVPCEEDPGRAMLEHARAMRGGEVRYGSSARASAVHSFGTAWCVLCLFFHQSTEKPCSAQHRVSIVWLCGEAQDNSCDGA